MRKPIGFQVVKGKLQYWSQRDAGWTNVDTSDLRVVLKLAHRLNSLSSADIVDTLEMFDVWHHDSLKK